MIYDTCFVVFVANVLRGLCAFDAVYGVILY